MPKFVYEGPDEATVNGVKPILGVEFPKGEEVETDDESVIARCRKYAVWFREVEPEPEPEVKAPAKPPAKSRAKKKVNGDEG